MASIETERLVKAFYFVFKTYILILVLVVRTPRDNVLCVNPSWDKIAAPVSITRKQARSEPKRAKVDDLGGIRARCFKELQITTAN